MYASSTEDASWGEMFRHHLDPDLSPFEVRRRMSTLEIRDCRCSTSPIVVTRAPRHEHLKSLAGRQR